MKAFRFAIALTFALAVFLPSSAQYTDRFDGVYYDLEKWASLTPRINAVYTFDSVGFKQNGLKNYSKFVTISNLPLISPFATAQVGANYSYSGHQGSVSTLDREPFVAKVKSIFDYYGKTYNVYFITCLNYFPYGEHSFYIHESQRLQKLTIENGLGAVFEGSPTMVEYYNDNKVYNHCWPIDSVILPDDLPWFGHQCWGKRFEYDDGIHPKIAQYNFRGKHAIKYVKLGRYHWGPLTELVVDGTMLEEIALTESEYCPYKSVDKVIYSRDGKELIFYPKCGPDEFEVGSGVEIIGKGAFQGRDITTVVLPESVQLIGDSAFFNDESLKKVELKSSPSIGKTVFISPDLEIYIYTINPPVITSTTFVTKPKVVYVPKHCSKYYYMDNIWRQYNIVEMDYEVDGVESVLVGEDEPFIKTSGRHVSVVSGDNSVAAEAFDALGRCVYSGHDKEFTLPTRGVYVIRVNGKAQKVFVP